MQIWGSLLTRPSQGPWRFREHACVYMDRCKPPLCVKLENPKLSCKECDHSLYCFLLHSNKCVCVCVRREREREMESEKENWMWWENNLRVEKRGQICLHNAKSFTHTKVNTRSVCFHSDLWEAVCHPARGHMDRISCPVLLMPSMANSVHARSLWIIINSAKICGHAPSFLSQLVSIS